jgi:hypothetical protein
MLDWDAIEARIVTLEQAKLSVKDLPMRALQDKLELDWQPNPALLLGDASFPRGGEQNVTIVASAGTATIGHGLGRLPTAVVACVTLGAPLGAGGNVEVVTGNKTADTFDVFVQFFGGAFAGTVRVAWIAI